MSSANNNMQLEEIKEQAFQFARLDTPSPNFGISIHEYGEPEEDVMWSIEERFRDAMFYESLELLQSNYPLYRCEPVENYYFELIKALEDVGAAVYEDDDLPWQVKVEFDKAIYTMRFSGCVKMETMGLEERILLAEPGTFAQLLAMIQDVQIPHEEILQESMKLYHCQKIMRVSVLALIEDLLEEHSCGCSIHIRRNGRLSIMVYGREPESMHIFFTIETDLEHVRADVIAGLT